MTDEEMAGGLTDEQMAGGEPAEEGGPESFLHPDKFKPSPQHRKFKNTGPIEQVRGEFAAQRAPLTTDVGDLTAGPILSGIDRATLGGLGAVMRFARAAEETAPGQAINRVLGAGPAEERFGQRSLNAMEDYRSQHPTLSMYTDVPAMLAKSTPLGVVGSAMTNAARRLPIGPMQQALWAAAGTGGVQAGAQAASEGASVPDIARATGEGAAMGALVGGPLAAAGRAIGGVGRAITESRGGRARQFIEDRGGDVGPTTPGRSGPFDRMETLGTSDADIGQQAEVSARKGLGLFNEQQDAVKGILGRRIGAIDASAEGQQLRDISGVVAKMEEASKSFGVTPDARAKLKGELDLIHENMGKGFNPETDSYLVSEADLNRIRRDLDGLARTGLSREAKYHPLREAANELRSMVDEGPYRETNKDYSRESFKEQKSRRLLGLSDRRGTPEESETSVGKVKNLITRRGQNTVTAGGQQDRLRQFEERHPDVAEEFIKPELLRKRADISFHLLPKRYGGLIDRTGSAVGGLALGELAMHAMQHGHLPSAQAIGALALGLGVQNLPAIQARLLYGPALAAQAAEPLLLNRVPLLAAGKRMNEEAR